MDLKRVQSGQKLVIPALTWNAVLDATEAHLRSNVDMQADGGKSRSSSTIIAIKNTCGTDLDRQQVLGISAPAILPSENADAFAHQTALVGVSPVLATHKGRFAVTLEPIKNNEIGLACIAGLCVVHVSITASTDTFADIGNGVTANLISAPKGSAAILWREAGSSGTVLALVKLGNPVAIGTHVNPKILGGSGDTADTEPWDILSQGAYDGVKWVAYRLYWSGTSGDPVYAFTRTPEYDSLGALVYVSAEVRSVAFSTGPCAS